MDEQKLAELRFMGKSDQVRELRTYLHHLLESQGCACRAADDVVLAVQEAISNVIKHAYKGDESGQMRLKVSRKANQWNFRLADFAPAIDTSRYRSRDLNVLRPGGLGVFIIEQIMDSVEFIKPGADEGNVLVMTKLLKPNFENKRTA